MNWYGGFFAGQLTTLSGVVEVYRGGRRVHRDH